MLVRFADPDHPLDCQIVYAEPFVYALAVTTTKISILLLYRRLFHAGQSCTNRIYAVAYWAAVGLTSCYPVIMFITMAAACRPVSFYWEQYLGRTDGVCIDVTLFYLVFGIVNMVIDVVILVSPIPRIISLQLNKRRKFSVIGIMLLGSLYVISWFSFLPFSNTSSAQPLAPPPSSVLGLYLHSRFSRSVCAASMFRIYYLSQLVISIDATWWMGPGSK